MAWTVTALKLIAGSGNKRSTRSPRTHLRCIPLECHGSDSKRSGTVSWHTSDPFFFMEVQWGDHRKMGASSRPDFSHLCASSWATSRPVLKIIAGHLAPIARSNEQFRWSSRHPKTGARFRPEHMKVLYPSSAF